MATLNFNAKDHEPMDVFDPVPTGWYPVVIEESEMKPNSAETGHYLELVGTIISEEFKGRKLWTRLNLDNPNPVAVEIANRQLSAICHAIDVMVVKDSSALHNIPHMWKAVYVDPVVDEDGKVIYEAKNEVKGFKAIEESDGVEMPENENDVPAWVTEGTGADTNEEGAENPKPAPKAKPKPKAKAKAKPKAKPKAAPTQKAPAPVKKDVDYDKFMTEKAAGIPYKEFIKKGWQNDTLISEGYMDDPGMDAAPEIPEIPDPVDTGTDEEPATKPPWVPD